MNKEQLEAEVARLQETMKSMAQEMNSFRTTKQELQNRYDELTRKLDSAESIARSEESRANQLNAELTGVREARTELENRFQDLQRARANMEDELLACAKFESIILETIQGAEIQRLFHNPTVPAMRQAAARIANAIMQLAV